MPRRICLAWALRSLAVAGCGLMLLPLSGVAGALALALGVPPAAFFLFAGLAAEPAEPGGPSRAARSTRALPYPPARLLGAWALLLAVVYASFPGPDPRMGALLIVATLLACLAVASAELLHLLLERGDAGMQSLSLWLSALTATTVLTIDYFL